MLLLGSSSIRRKELLESTGLSFKTVKPVFDEDQLDKEGYPPQEYNLESAKRKALSLKETFSEYVIITADTIVVIDKEILGKPRDEEEAKAMLRKLSGKTHKVYTSVCILYKGKKDLFIDSAKVTFNDLTEKEIDDYVATKEPLDKSGAYAIQSISNTFVKSFEGDFHTIMGLPLKIVLEKLKRYPV